MFPPREPHAQRRRGMDHAQSTSLECGGGKLGMDDEVLEGGGVNRKGCGLWCFSRPDRLNSSRLTSTD